MEHFVIGFAITGISIFGTLSAILVIKSVMHIICAWRKLLKKRKKKNANKVQ